MSGGTRSGGAAGRLCRVLSWLVTVMVASTPAMTATERPVPICGTGSGPIQPTPDACRASLMIFTPMKPRITDRPADR